MHLGGSMESMVSEVKKKKSEGRTKKEIANEKTPKNDGSELDGKSLTDFLRRLKKVLSPYSPHLPHFYIQYKYIT